MNEGRREIVQFVFVLVGLIFLVKLFFKNQKDLGVSIINSLYAGEKPVIRTGERLIQKTTHLQHGYEQGGYPKKAEKPGDVGHRGQEYGG